MDFRKSFSKPFRKLKDKLPGSSRKRGSRSGSEDSRKGREDNIKGGGVGQRNSYLNLVFGVGSTMSGPSQEGSNADRKKAVPVDINPPAPPPSISHIGEPNSM